MTTPTSPPTGLQRRDWLLQLAAVGISALLPGVASANRPALMLASNFRAGTNIQNYWVSEKFDGVRGYWDGTQLWTRGGERVQTPDGFTAGWPSIPMDGELWAGLGRFEHASSTVRQQTPNDQAWREITYKVFDLPASKETFTDRLQALNTLFGTLNLLQVKPVAQAMATTEAQLQQQLHTVTQAGGEGLVLHRGDSLYRGVRSDDLLKLKLHEDAEARVMGYEPGRGKYEGLLGALRVETPEGQRFKIGTGLSDAQRTTPPPIGSWVTYRYRGLTERGVPRFASFLRMADGVSLSVLR